MTVQVSHAQGQLLGRVRPVELRYYLVAPHYRSTLEYSDDALAEAAAAYHRIETFVHRVHDRVGAGEVVRHYDVEFTGLTGDRVGAWFEAMIEDGGANQWYDWFRVLVRDGSLKGERIDLVSLVGDSLGVTYGVRNIGSGGLKDIGGTLRAVSGIVVEDSLSALKVHLDR